MGTAKTFIPVLAFAALLISGCDITITSTSNTIKSGGVDLVTPSITQFSIPASSSSLTISPIQLVATDNVAVDGYFLSDSNVVPLVSSGVFSSSPPTSFTFTSAGVRTLYAFVKDAAGNISPVASAVVNISIAGDSIAPVVNVFTMPASATQLAISGITISASDNTSVTGFFVSEASSKPLSSASGWSASPPTSYTFLSYGSKTLYAFAKDAAGNVSASKSASITLTQPADISPPVVNSVTMASTSSSLVVALTVSATDNIAVIGYFLSESATKPLASATGWVASAPTSFTFSSAGTKTLNVFAKDAAGNVSASKSATVAITLPAPVVKESIFTSQLPESPNSFDNQSYELGMKFQSAISGQITAIRYYKGSSETGSHTGTIWSANGTKLASVAFANESASGWQVAQLASPLSIAARTIYVVSVNSNTYYADTINGLASSVSNGNLSSIADNANGVFNTTMGAFPTTSWSNSNYFRDVEFVSTIVPTGSATLSWTPPSTNTDGTLLTDLSGYKIYIGTSPGVYGSNIAVSGASTSSRAINNLSIGTTYYFAISAVNTLGAESALSTEVSKLIQ